MRQAQAIVFVVAAVLAVGALTACSSGESGKAAPVASTAVPAPTTAAKATAWNPCGIPDSDIAAVGLDPGTKQVGAGGVKFPGWNICAWLGKKPNWFNLNVFSTTDHTYSEAVNNTTLYKDPQQVVVAGRQATQLRSATDPNGCTIALDVSAGPVLFTVTRKFSADSPGDSCSEANRLATELAKDVPSS